jgi:DNA polymerase III sliding clamp (beta) subunit (PCNA family)
MATKKFKVNGSALKKALQTINPAMQGKSVIPINECVLFSVSPESCSIMGTDTHLTVTSECECSSKESFEALIPFKQLYALASKIGNKELVIEIGKNVSVKENNKHEFGVAIDAALYTKGRDFNPDFEIPIDDDVLYAMQQAAKSVDVSHGNPAFHNVWIDIDERKLKVIGTTGGVLFRYLQEIDDKIKFSGMVSVAFVKALSGLTGATLESDGHSLRVKTDKATVTVVLSESKVVSTNSFYPERTPNCEVNKHSLIEALDMITIYEIPEKWRQVGLSFPKKDKMLVKFEHYPTSQFFEAELDVKHSVELDGEINFNLAYLSNVISLFPESVKNIHLTIKSFNQAVNIDSPEDVSINCVIVPVMTASPQTQA